MEDSFINEPTLAFGFTILEIGVVGIMALAGITFLFAVCRLAFSWKQPPYRVVLENCYSDDKSTWVLERRDEILFDAWDWSPVYKSANKREVQKKAREALFAHYRFRDFVNESDAELIRDGEVVQPPVEHRLVLKGHWK